MDKGYMLLLFLCSVNTNIIFQVGSNKTFWKCAQIVKTNRTKKADYVWDLLSTELDMPSHSMDVHVGKNKMYQYCPGKFQVQFMQMEEGQIG